MKYLLQHNYVFARRFLQPTPSDRRGGRVRWFPGTPTAWWGGGLQPGQRHDHDVHERWRRHIPFLGSIPPLTWIGPSDGDRPEWRG